MPLTPFDPTVPPDNEAVSAGASRIRNLTQLIINFLSVSFNMTTGVLNPGAVPNGLPTPYGAAGNTLVSTGSVTPPVWQAPGVLITGMIVQWPSATPPGGWLNCDGSTPLIATYPALAAFLGTTFGGNGSTTFGLPDFRGRVPVGLGTGTGGGATTWTLAETIGEETHTLATTEMPAHAHTEQDSTSGWSRYSGQHQNGTQPAGIYPVVTGAAGSQSGSAGGGLAHNNLQPSLGIGFVIKT
jgi:microcystin-dependent protein